jgi:DNA-binding response OmpR family regulator
MNTSLRSPRTPVLATHPVRATTRILVVGHDESTGAMLDTPGFEVQTAVDGAEALTKISQHQPDVIVIDATTSGPSHWELPVSCSTEGRDHTTPIVALSTGDQLREVVAREGVWVCLVKPVKAEVLVGAVERIANFCSAR